MSTTCRNYECPFKTDGSCDHNVYRDGPICTGEGKAAGFHYRSQIQAIVIDYEQECERKGVEPIPRNIYLDG